MYKQVESYLKLFIEEYTATLRQINDDIDRWAESEHLLLALAILIPFVTTVGVLCFYRVLLS